MKRIDTPIPDVKLIEPEVFEDGRGFFFESWNREAFSKIGIDAEFVQDNHSKSSASVLRGLHYQTVQPQGKLVRVTAGSAFDVAIDLRRSSSTFGAWVGYELSADNKRMLWIPPGFAHGFLAISDGTEFLYKCTQPYAPQYDRSLRWNDPEIGIVWPLRNGELPSLSQKDAAAPLLQDAETFG